MNRKKIAIIGSVGLPAKYGGWETLGHVEDILDGEDFIDCCIDIDEMIEFTN